MVEKAEQVRQLSVILTVHDREDAVLLSVLRMLARGPAALGEVVIVNDRSQRFKYGWLPDYLRGTFELSRIVDLDPYEKFDLGGGYGNPARAFNAGLSAASCERVMILSSDTLVPPATIRRSFLWDVKAGPWTPRVMDLETQMEYCGPTRVFPMPWALVVDRDAARACGGWDERYLKGLCFEDNDFVGRLAAMQGGFCADWSAVAYHISHDQPAYKVDEPVIAAANDRNRALTKEKWGGIPFDPAFTPFDVGRRPHPSGLCVYKVTCEKDKLAAMGVPMETTA